MPRESLADQKGVEGATRPLSVSTDERSLNKIAMAPARSQKLGSVSKMRSPIQVHQDLSSFAPAGDLAAVGRVT